MSKKHFNEAEICQNFISPAVEPAGWNLLRQIGREILFTAGRVIVRGKIAAREWAGATAQALVVGI